MREQRMGLMETLTRLTRPKRERRRGEGRRHRERRASTWPDPPYSGGTYKDERLQHDYRGAREFPVRTMAAAKRLM
ncbi:hypothetical protein FIBSPDRAFT_960258, partial [Athelia psychrophila]